MSKNNVKRFASIMMTSILSLIVLTGCAVNTVDTPNDYKHVFENKFEPVEDSLDDKSNCLFYDKQTKIIYICITNNNGGYLGYGYMSPYYSENGKICKYEDEKIVEIN